MGVEGEAALHAGEEMFAARGDIQDGPPGEICGGEARHTEVGPGQGLSGESGVQALGGSPDGVSFGQASMMRERWG
jgi:hypothetical protein